MGFPSARLLTSFSALGSLAFAASLGVAYFELDSELALAQAADSAMDVAGAVVLGLAVRVAGSPPDPKHPLGHGRAEPLGALLIAVLAAVLAVEVVTSAVESLLRESMLRLDSVLVVLFVGKVFFRGLVYLGARRGRGPALDALTVDSRNDLLVGGVAVLGYLAAQRGYPAVDAWLALPLGGYIGWSGFELGRENLALLMGQAPTAARQAELIDLASSVEGILGAHDLMAHHVGSEFSVHVHVVVSGDLTVRQAHDLGERVRARLEDEPDVVHCSVHIDPDDVVI